MITHVLGSVVPRIALFSLAGVLTSSAQPVQQLIATYSGKTAWDSASGSLSFTSSGRIDFSAAGARSFIWQIPAEVKRIRIGKNVTVNGAFHSHSTVSIGGEDRKTSIVYGTEEQAWPQKHNLKAYEICSFQNLGGTMIVSNLTSLNPRAFHVRGWKKVMHVASCDFLDTRGGWGNHSDGFEGGDGSTVDNCYFESGDDIIKVYSDITVINTTIKMVQNAVPIQLGWGNYSDGAVGTFKNLTVIGDGGRPNEGNAIISGRKGHYTVTINIDGCHVENPNGTWVSLREDSMTLRGSVTNAHIRLKSFAGEHQKGINLMTICGATEKKAAYDCANGVSVVSPSAGPSSFPRVNPGNVKR
jgi:hypothetical protein